MIVFLTTISIKAWNGLTASQGDKLDYQKWNQLVATVQSGIPSGFIGAFDLPSCPTGWTEVTNARGRTIIGAGNGAGSTTSVGDVGGDKSGPNISLKARQVPGANTPQNGFFLGSGGSAGGAATIYVDPNTNGTDVTLGGLQGAGTAPDNMQPYIAYLYCKKN